jgi:CheY-like chemotaxis protein
MTGQILVIDDDPAIRKILRTLLTSAGYQVVVADDGDTALQVLEGGDPLPDLILLDLMMPQHNGWALLTTLREHPAWQRIPVVVVSAAADADQQASRFNVFCLPKPFTAEALLGIAECYCALPVRRAAVP